MGPQPRVLALLLATTCGATFASGPGAAQAPRLEPLATIGCALCAGPAAFESIQALAVAADGRVLVADRGAPVIRIFRDDGTLLLAHGDVGDGPGEHRTIIHLAPLPGGGHEAFDLRLRRRTLFDTAGRVVTTQDAGSFFESASRAGGSDLYVTRTDFRTFANELLRWNPEREAPARIATVRPAAAETSDHATLKVAARPGGGVAFGYGARAYVIHRLDAAGRSLPALEREVPRPRRTAAELAEASESARTRAARMAGMARTEEAAGRPPTVAEEESHFSALAYDERGRLWILTNRGGLRRTVLDVFGSDGGYLGEVAVAGRLRKLALGAGLLAGLSVDADGVERVALWRVR